MVKLIKPSDTYLYKIKIESTRAMHEICSKIFKLRHENDVNYVIPVSLLFTLNRFRTHCCNVSIVEFEQINAVAVC